MKNKILKTSAITVFIILLSFVIYVNKVNAQASRINLSISPPVTYMSIKPGEEQTYQIRVENLGDSTLEITPSLLDFDADNKTGQPIVKQTGTFKYIRINDGLSSFGESFYLEPKQKKAIPITVDIPRSEQEEEYAMTVFFTFKNKTDEKQKDSQAKVAGTVGSNLILLVTRNNLDRGNIIVKNITSMPTIDSFMPIRFTALAENIGKNATPASGSAKISNWQNREIAEFEIHPDMILANSSRELREKDFLSNEFRFKKPFLLGIYRISIELNKNSSPNSDVFVLNKTIVALPFSIILLPLSGIILYSGYRVILKKTNPRKKEVNETDQIK
ncbi:hypothetical protein GW926_03745 [Candidatus Pacearchaeota archaeon]|nr:hypothetical protein [Candidatus Pacearchaeota archaeon]